jgi:hypothetical protein
MLFLKIKSINVLFNGSLVFQYIKYIKKYESFIFIKKNLFFKTKKKLSFIKNSILVKQNFLDYKKQYLN